MYSLPLYISADHAGIKLKTFLKAKRTKYSWKDLGPHSDKKTDYPLWAEKLCLKMQPSLVGVLICGSGQGMAIKANRFPHIRAALCQNTKTAKLARSHNHANVLCLGARLTPFDEALNILDTFLSTPFDFSPSHKARVSQLYKNPLP